MRYNEDVRLAYELNNLILRAQPKGKQLPVAFAGRYNSSEKFQTNFLYGEMMGHPIFGAGANIEYTTTASLAFMKNLGINYDSPDDDQLEQALYEAVFIPPYPDPGCIKRTENFIVIRLSDDLYY